MTSTSHVQLPSTNSEQSSMRANPYNFWQQNAFLSHAATPNSGPGTPQCWEFTVTLRHTALGRTPLDEWSVRRRDLHLTTHNTHKRRTSMPSARFEPATPANKRPRNHSLDKAQWDRLIDQIMIYSQRSIIYKKKKKIVHHFGILFSICASNFDGCSTSVGTFHSLFAAILWLSWSWLTF
jgi:hypothetical protein